MEETKAEYGIILMLDALGVSNYNLKESKQFLSKRDNILNNLLDEQKKMKNQYPVLPRFNMLTFGDTIVIYWSIKKDDIMKTLPGAGEWGRHVVRMGIANNILLRGCISVGEFISKDSTILGPAIADAASWYEVANWFGVLLTPQSQYYLITLIENSKHNKQLSGITWEQWFVEYDVPIASSTKRMWVVSWPYDLYALEDKDMTPLEVMSTSLWHMPIPKGTESKYENSVTFFKWYGEEIFPLIKNKKHN